MRTEASATPASPLTVWFGPTRYVFAPGRDVLVGYGQGVDIPLGRPGNGAPPPPTAGPDVVLRFTGSHWVAINSSPHGMFVNGARVSTVDIRSGQAITIGDPQRGPRLVFQIGPPAGPPPRPAGPPQAPPHQRPPQFRPVPAPPPPPPAPAPTPPPAAPPPPEAAQPPRREDPNLQAPSVRATQRIRIAPPQPPVAEPPSPPEPPEAVAPPPPVAPAAPPPPVQDEEPQGQALIEQMTTRKLPASRPSFRTEEPSATYRLPLRADARTLGVAAYQLGLAVDGHEMLTDISFTARTGTLTAVVGPSPARNSALLQLLAGTRAPSVGHATVDGHDVHAEPEPMRSRIGIVARDERVHPRLTVERELRYAAELRLPPDTPPEHRRRVVDQLLDELELTPYRAKRIGKLPPEARRCASLAVELLTRPTLLVVDEPTAGLDAAQQEHVMAVLRRQADVGCVVVVAMSSQESLSHLNMCDQVLVLTSTGATAFLGTPLQVESSMGTAEWAGVVEQVRADPEGAHRAYLGRRPAAGEPGAPPEAAAPWPPPAQLPVARQIRLVARRQLRLLLGERLYLLFLTVLPFVLAALTLLIPGDSGLERPNPASSNPHEAIEILAALNIAAVIVGTALSIRAVVEERRLFRREQAIGLWAPAYLAGKAVVLTSAAAALTAVVFAIVVAVKGGPVHGAALLHNATAELYVSVAVTAMVSAVVGLALSAVGNRMREVLPLVVPVILASALFNGSLVQLVGKWGLQQVSWFVPAQWGFAASASTVDLRRVDELAANALMWTHYSGWWVFDMAMLLALGAVAAGFALYRLRAPRREPHPAPDREEQTVN